MGWEEGVDVVCGAGCILSQLKTLKSVVHPEGGPGDEQDNTGDSPCMASWKRWTRREELTRKGHYMVKRGYKPRES